MRPGTATRHPSIIGETYMPDHFSIHALRPRDYIEDGPDAHSERTLSPRGRPKFIHVMPADPLLADPIRFDVPHLRDRHYERLMVDIVMYSAIDVRAYCNNSFSKWRREAANITAAAHGLYFLLYHAGFSVACEAMGSDEDRMRNDIMSQFSESRIAALMETEQFKELMAEHERVNA